MTLPFSMSDPLLPDAINLSSPETLLPVDKRDLDLSSKSFWRRESPKSSARFYISTPMEEV